MKTGFGMHRFLALMGIISIILIGSLLMNSSGVPEPSTLEPTGDSAPPRREPGTLDMETVAEEPGKAAAAVYRVPFPDGSSIPVRMRPLQGVRILEIDSLSGSFSELEMRARAGDIAAALTLSQALNMCKAYGYSSPEELQTGIAELEQSRSVPFAHQPGIAQVSPDINGNVDLELWRQELTATYESCRGIPRNQMDRSHEFLLMAAEADRSKPLVRWHTKHRQAKQSSRRMRLLGRLETITRLGGSPKATRRAGMAVRPTA